VTTTNALFCLRPGILRPPPMRPFAVIVTSACAPAWASRGRTPPGRIMLLIHGNKVTKELARRPQLPLGLAELHTDTDRSIYRTLPHSDDGLLAYTEQMEPGDRMHLYTDGVIEGRAADCSRFGIDLLSDFVIRHSHSGTPAPEMLRRPTRTITEYQHGRISADATIVLIEWMPPLL
jgi:hypothetical protein